MWLIIGRISEARNTDRNSYRGAWERCPKPGSGTRGLVHRGARGAKFWLSIVNELKNRGQQDILVAAVGGLSGFPDAIGTVYLATDVHLCFENVVRSSLRFVPYK